MKVKIDLIGITEFDQYHYICSSMVNKDTKLLTKKIIPMSMNYFDMEITNIKHHRRNRIHLKNEVTKGHLSFNRLYLTYK